LEERVGGGDWGGEGKGGEKEMEGEGRRREVGKLKTWGEKKRRRKNDRFSDRKRTNGKG